MMIAPRPEPFNHHTASATRHVLLRALDQTLLRTGLRLRLHAWPGETRDKSERRQRERVRGERLAEADCRGAERSVCALVVEGVLDCLVDVATRLPTHVQSRAQKVRQTMRERRREEGREGEGGREKRERRERGKD